MAGNEAHWYPLHDITTRGEQATPPTLMAKQSEIFKIRLDII